MMQTAELKAPFVWFGGKRRVADLVWSALGDVDQYVEPFAGSLAVRLARHDAHDITQTDKYDAQIRTLTNKLHAILVYKARPLSPITEAELTLVSEATAAVENRKESQRRRERFNRPIEAAGRERN